MAIASAALIQIIREQFALDWYGIHGASPWARVRENGFRIAEVTGADPKIVELFAFLHDSKRINYRTDWQHGARASLFAGAAEIDRDSTQGGLTIHILAIVEPMGE